MSAVPLPRPVVADRSTTVRRVLHLINGEAFAGAERVQDLLAESLPARGFQVEFACLKPREFPRNRRSEAPLLLTPMSGRFDLRPAWHLARAVRERGYVLVHTHTPRAALIGRVVAARTGVPFVHHVHSPTSRDTASTWRNAVNAAVEDWSTRGAKRFLAVSGSLTGYLAGRGVEAARVRLVPNGVRTPGPLPRRDAPSQRWTLGCMALFRPRKGVEVLLSALAALRAQGRHVDLRLIGGFEDATHEAKLRRQAAELGLVDCVQWRGFAREVDDELRALDLFVLPSLYGEGMPMVLLEAMGAGVPSVATDVEGIPEVLEHGRCGWLCRPSDVESLVRALTRAMDDPAAWSAVRERAYARQVALYSERAMAAAVAEVYEEVLGS